MRGCLSRLAVLSLAAVGASANADIVVMQNGDRITGDVNRIWGNDVSVEPEYSDEFVVDQVVPRRRREL